MERRTFQNSLCIQSGKNKGFTLAELLIVVAIIAVLVAIAIPVFQGQLEASKEASDLASIRNAYAEAIADMIMDNKTMTGSAETGLMKHTGLFKHLGEATIGEIDLKVNSQASHIVKDYTVVVTARVDETGLVELTLDVGNGGHILGTKASNEEIARIKKENSAYPGYKSYPYEEFWANGNKLSYYHPSYAGVPPIYFSEGSKEAVYGVPMTLVVNDDNSNRLYFKWDGACWYQSRGAGYPWERVGPK